MQKIIHGAAFIIVIRLICGFCQVCSGCCLPEAMSDAERYGCQTLSSQKATAAAAATFSESTPWDMGIITR